MRPSKLLARGIVDQSLGEAGVHLPFSRPFRHRAWVSCWQSNATVSPAPGESLGRGAPPGRFGIVVGLLAAGGSRILRLE